MTLLLGLQEGKAKWVYVSLVVATGILFSFLSRNAGFVLLIGEVLVLGFAFTYKAYQEGLTSMAQVPLVVHHIAFALTLILLWILFYFIHQHNEIMDEMKEKVKRLQKMEPQANVYTRHEFFEKAKVIWTGMKRRNESGYIGILSLADREPHYTKQALFKTIGKVLVSSVRGDYDLVGKYKDDSLIVLLQNADEKGLSIVLNRMENQLAEHINLNESPYTISVEDVDHFMEQQWKGEDLA